MISKETIIKSLRKEKENKGEVTTSSEISEMNFDVADTITIAGQKSSGKSWFLSYLANLYPKVILYDPRWERYTSKDKKAMSEKSLQMPDKWVTAYSLTELKKHVYAGKTHILYHPLPLVLNERTDEDRIEEFNLVSDFIYSWGNFTFFIDEADQYCDVYHIPDGFKNIMEYSRHRNLGIVAATRRFQHLNTRIPRLSDKLVLFRLSGNNRNIARQDFKYIQEYVVEPEGTESKSDYFDQWKHKLTGLEDRHFFIFDTKTLTEFKPITDMIK